MKWDAANTAILALLTVLFGFALTSIWGQARDIGQLTAKMDGLAADVAQISSATTMGFKAMDDRLFTIASQLSQSETQPSRLLMQAGIAVQPDVWSAFVGGRVVTFPKDKGAEERLIQAGWEKTQISPVIYGYSAPVSARNAPAPQ